MLKFFRKYERYFFVVITIVIVISFSFFGTYRAMEGPQVVEKTAFVAIDGTEVTAAQLEEMARFIATDNEDKLIAGGAWGPNFLNDGVIKKDFLENGFAETLALQYRDDLKKEWTEKHQREKLFKPYVHPSAGFISAVNIWKAVSPGMEQNLIALQKAEDPLDPNAVQTRVKLFLEELRFPQPLLRMVIRQQEKQYSFIQPDPRLAREELSLFGYRNLEDWFGTSFVRLAAEYIINSAILAEQEGYRVSSNEAWADLLRNGEISFQQNIRNPNLGVENGSQYIQEELRRLGIDQSQAISLWRKVLLFRRLIHGDGNTVLVDADTFSPLQTFSKETAKGEIYELPEDLRLNDFRALQKFEVYLNAVTGRNKNESSLQVPTKFLSPDGVAKSAPELVQRRFLLEIGSMNKADLQVKVGVRQTWDWELEDKNWEILKKQFPELGVKKGADKGQRTASLNSVDLRTRARVDAFARKQIVENHPEWILEALKDEPYRLKTISLKKNGEGVGLPGLNDSKALISLLDQYPKSAEKLSQYTPDKETYYKIKVLDSSRDWEVLTFTEANRDGSLDRMVDATLEKKYPEIRLKDPEKFQGKNGAPLPFASVKNSVAEIYFAPVLESIKKDYYAVSGQKENKALMIPDFAAHLRLYPYMRGLLEKFKKNPDEMAQYFRETKDVVEDEKLAVRPPLANQWMIERRSLVMERNAPEKFFKTEEIFSLNPNEWSKVAASPSGEIAFFQLSGMYSGKNPESLYRAVMESHTALSRDARKTFMDRLLKEMEDKNAISLSYLSKEPAKG